jgi:hypothetical protein
MSREKPLAKEVAYFVKHHLADKHLFAPFTGQDYSAWEAFIHTLRLYGRSDTAGRELAIEAMRALVRASQQKDDVLAVFKQSIPACLDWSDEPKLWLQIAPPARDDIGRARGDVTWPCGDGERICHHERTKLYKRAEREAGWSEERECLDCGCVFRTKLPTAAGGAS